MVTTVWLYENRLIRIVHHQLFHASMSCHQGPVRISGDPTGGSVNALNMHYLQCALPIRHLGSAGMASPAPARSRQIVACKRPEENNTSIRRNGIVCIYFIESRSGPSICPHLVHTAFLPFRPVRKFCSQIL